MPAPAATPQSWTIGSLLQWTERFFADKAVESPRLDAQVLLAFSLGCTRPQLYTRYDEEPPQADRARFRQLVRLRAEGSPVAYLVGFKEFFLLPIEVTSDVLIPRPSTETLVMTALERLKGRVGTRVLDLCCGSGCVGIAIAKHAPGATVVMTDNSPAALAVAASNARKHQVAARVTCLVGDLLDAVAPGQRFDVIVSNPPYIPTADLAGLAREVRDHEPRSALDGGPDGLAVIRRIVARAANFLTTGGQLLIEVGADQSKAVRALFESNSGLGYTVTVTDGDGTPRVIVARRSALESCL